MVTEKNNINMVELIEIPRK